MNCDALIYFALDSSTWTTVLCAPVVFVKNRVKAKLQKPYSRLHTKLQLSSLKDKKVVKLVQSARCAVQNVHCAHPVSQKIVY